MKSTDLFIIILKIFGIYLIKDVLAAIPPMLSDLVQLFSYSPEVGVVSLFFSILALCIRLAIVYFLLFKPQVLVSKLKLTSAVSEKPIKMNMHRSTIYTIAILVAGIFILAFAVPELVKQLYAWYEYVDSKKSYSLSYSHDFSGLFIAMAEVLIGLLFLGNQKTIVNFIELKRREARDGWPKDSNT